MERRAKKDGEEINGKNAEKKYDKDGERTGDKD
jgi:hypothetical protein